MFRVFKSAWFARYARKQDISDQQLLDAAQNVRAGCADADLGGGVFKQRLARKGRGKSGGYRCVMLFDGHKSTFVVYCFAKKDLASLRESEVDAFKKMAKHVFSLTEGQLGTLIANGQFEEVLDNDEKL